MFKKYFIKALILLLGILVLSGGVYFGLEKIEANKNQKRADNLKQVIMDMVLGKPVNIVCYGDSITAGGGSEGKGPSEISYPEHLEVLLREYYKNDSIDVINSGIGSARVDDMIVKWDELVSSYDPDIIIFMAGTNDAFKENITISEFSNDLEKVTKLAKKTPMIFLNTTPRFKRHNGINGANRIEYFRQEIEENAKEHSIPLIDVYEGLMNLYKDRGLIRGKISLDGSHYTSLGYKYLAEIVFEQAFTNDDIKIKPNQFKDIGGQWIVTKKNASGWTNIEALDGQAIRIKNNYVELFLYLEEWEKSNLAVHFVVDNESSINQNVSVINLDIEGAEPVKFETSPKKASGQGFYQYDYAVPVCELKSGLNRIRLETTTSVMLSGFSVIPVNDSLYQEPSQNGDNTTSVDNKIIDNDLYPRYEEISKNVTCEPKSDLAKVFRIIPNVSLPLGYRLRAFVNPYASFYIGQQSNRSEYLSTHRIYFDGVNAKLDIINSTGEMVNAASMPLAIKEEGTDIKIDFKTSISGFSIWIEDTQLYEDNIPLSIGDVVIKNESKTSTAYVNPVMKINGPMDLMDVIKGEAWISFSDNLNHIIGIDGTERTTALIE
jgi:lysophospholipase L1-like esterase